MRDTPLIAWTSGGRKWIGVPRWMPGLFLLIVAVWGASLQAGARRLDVPHYRRHWAVVVGVNYSHLSGAARAEVPELITAQNDAKAVYDALVKHYGYRKEDVRLLIGADATHDRIRAAFGEGFLGDRQRVTEEDAVLFYFAGHGSRLEKVGEAERYIGLLYPNDIRVLSGKGVDSISCIRIDEMMRWLEDSCAARHKLVILDSCHSGEVFNFDPRRSAGVHRGFRATLFDRPAFQAIAASTASQMASDGDRGEGHSPFTRAMLDALEHGMGSPDRKLFTASELFAYIPGRFAEWENVRQDPRGGWISGEGDFYFFPNDLEPGDFPASQLALSRMSPSRDHGGGEDGAATNDSGGHVPVPVWMIVGVVAVVVTAGFYRRRQASFAALTAANSPATAPDPAALPAQGGVALPPASRPRVHPALADRAGLLEGADLATWKVPLLVGGSLWAVSTMSLALAYYAPWTTEAWSLRFNQLGDPGRSPGLGFIVEAVRSLVFISLVTFMAWYKFHQESKALFSWRRFSKRVNIARGAFLLIALGFGALEATRHLTVGRAPQALAAWAAEYSVATTPLAEWYPYATYLPYSLINYMLVVPTLIIVPMMALSFDLPSLLRANRNLRSTIKDEDTSEEEVRANFAVFENECHLMCTRYLDVLALVAVAVHFEYWLGKLTLTEEAFSTMQPAQILVALAFVWILSITYLFGAGLETTKTVLAARGSPYLTGWAREHNALTFVKTVFLYGISGLIVLSLGLPLLNSLLGWGIGA